jgi:hypothetical protein
MRKTVRRNDAGNDGGGNCHDAEGGSLLRRRAASIAARIEKTRRNDDS